MLRAGLRWVLALALVIGLAASAAAQSFTLTLQPNKIPAVTQGVAYNVGISAVGGNADYSLAVTAGALPPGINLTGGAGTWALTGTSNVPGNYSFTITATDIDGNTGFRPYTLSIGTSGGLTISPASPLPNGTINVAYSVTLTASGGNGNYTFTLNSGTLPNGVTLAAGGLLSGTPTNGGTFNNIVVDVRDTNGNTGTTTYTLHIGTNSLSLSPAGPVLPGGTQGSAYSQTITASGGTGPYTFSLIGALPNGLSLDNAGNITGTPLGTGQSNFTVHAVDSFNNFVSKAYSITVGTSSLTVSPNSLPNATQGSAYSQTITAGGGTTPYTFAVTGGALPAGLSLSSGGGLSGTPSVNGTFNFTITATDPNFNTGSKAYNNFIVNPTPLTVGPANLPPGTRNSPYNQSVTASGGTGSYSFTLLPGGPLPTGLNLNPNTGAITGTPSVAGSFTFTVQVTDQTPTTGTKQFTINIGVTNSLTLTPPPLPAGTRNSPYSTTITAGGGSGSYTFAITGGSLPNGLSISSAGVISGTPTAAGTFNFTVGVTDSLNNTGSQGYTINVGSNSLTLTLPPLPTGTQGVPYNQTLSASGATGNVTYTLTSGSLPPGNVTLSSTGTISGIPNATGSFAFSVQATDSLNNTGSQAYNITVGGNVLTFTPPPLPNGTQGVAYSSGVTASGGNGSYTYSIATGALPANVNLNASTGAITGTPLGSGTSNFTVRAIDTVGNTGTSSQYSINIGTVSLTVTPANLPAGTVGVAYSRTVHASGGTGGPYTFTISAGALPVGLTLDSNSGTISGTPNTGGSYDFTVQARDAMGNVGTWRYNPMWIGTASLTLNPTTLPAAVMGKAYRQTVSATGGTAPYTFSITLGGLPPGLTLNASTGVISGTPTALGPATFTIQALDSRGNIGSQRYSITNRPDPALDPEVQGLVAAQVATAQRFATAQVTNVGRHLDSLHDRFNPCSVNFGIAPPIEQGVQMQQPYGGQYYAPQTYAPQTYANPNQLYSPSAQYGASGAQPYAPAPARPIPGLSECASDWMSNASIWTAGAFQFGQMTPTGLAANNKFITAGLTAGADLRLSERLIVGAALGYGADRSDVGSSGTRSDATSLSASLYASLRVLDRVFLDGVLGYGSLGFDNKRWVAGDGAVVDGKRSGSYWFGALTASLELRRGNAKLAPYVRADFISASLDGYSEQGTSAQLLTYDAMKVNAMSGAIGLRGSIDIATSFGTLTPTARLEYRQTSQGAYNQALYYSDLGGGLGSTLSQASTAMGVTTGAIGLQARAAGGLTAEIEYGLSSGAGALMAQTIRAALRLPF